MFLYLYIFWSKSNNWSNKKTRYRSETQNRTEIKCIKNLSFGREVIINHQVHNTPEQVYRADKNVERFTNRNTKFHLVPSRGNEAINSADGVAVRALIID